eukprot:307094_1
MTGHWDLSANTAVTSLMTSFYRCSLSFFFFVPQFFWSGSNFSLWRLFHISWFPVTGNRPGTSTCLVPLIETGVFVCLFFSSFSTPNWSSPSCEGAEKLVRVQLDLGEDGIVAHLRRVGGLDLNESSLNLRLDRLLRRGVDHLRADLGDVRDPGDEHELAALAVGGVVLEVIHGVARDVLAELGDELVVGGALLA